MLSVSGVAVATGLHVVYLVNTMRVLCKRCQCKRCPGAMHMLNAMQMLSECDANTVRLESEFTDERRPKER